MSMAEVIRSITKEMYQQTRKETIVFISKSEGDIVSFLKYLQSKLEEQQKEYILDKQHDVLIAPNYDVVGKSIHGTITGAGYGYCTYYCLSSNFSENTYTDMEKEKLKDILTHTRENAEQVSEPRILEMLGLI